MSLPSFLQGVYLEVGFLGHRAVGGGGETHGELMGMGRRVRATWDRVSVWEDEKVLETEGGGVCRTMRVCVVAAELCA